MKFIVIIPCLLILIVFFITNLPLVSAQVISISSDKNCYSELDKITFSGKAVPRYYEMINVMIETTQGDEVKNISIKPRDSSGYFKSIPFKVSDILNHGSFIATGYIQTDKLSSNAKTSFKFSSSCSGGSSGGTPYQPTITYHNTQLSLQVTDGSNPGYIKVKPTLTYGSGNTISTTGISIYVGGNYKTTVSSNQWSSNIFAGSGSKIIQANYPEQESTSDRSIKFRASSDTKNFVISSKPVNTYHNTQLSLQVTDGSNPGYIKVKPTLTYGSGNTISTTEISIYAGGNYKTTVSSNQWSSNIFTGSGSKIIQANYPEQESTSDSSIKFRASSDTKNFVISSGGSSDDAFPIEYVIAGIVIVAIVAGIGIALSKRKKATPIPVQSPGNIHVTSGTDDTQFWVCPRCGRDIQMKNGKQFCSSCNVYL